MDPSLFRDRSPGRLVRTIDGAPAFVPTPLPPDLDLASLFEDYGSAMAALGKLNAKLLQLGNPNLIIRPLQRREALTSSAMEGTYSTSDELALVEAGDETAARSDTLEVRNYVRALTRAVALMERLPICHRLIKETHSELLGSLPAGRGGNKRPDEYKREQNWIGGPSAITARFVPAQPLETIDAMDALEAFINREPGRGPPPLIEAGLVHYQFETIHPFADGNGRVGRILIPLVLLARQVLDSPVFYPSASLGGRKQEYIDRMFAVSAEGDWTGWLRFFLEVCRDTSSSSIAVIDRLVALQIKYRYQAMENSRSNNVLLVIDKLFLNPVVSTTMVMDEIGVTRRTARITIASLEEIGVLEKLSGSKMPEYFMAREILRASD